MIKKLLKSLLGMFFVGFGIINFSSAGYVGHIGQSFNSPFDNGLNIGIYKYGNFISKKVSLEKKVFYLNSNSGYNSFWFWGNNNGNIGLYNYFQTSYKISQGFINDYSICDYFSGDNLSEISSPGNCSVSVISTGSYDIINNFLSNLNENDYYYFNINYGSNHIYSNNLCFASSLFDKSLCFTNCYTDTPSSRTCYSFGGSYNYGNVSNSLELNPSFDNLSSFILFNSPGSNNNNGNRDGENTINNNTQNNQICPTIKELMQNMGENYNTGLCYNNTTYFNGTSFEQIDKNDIFTIFNNDYENYTNRISIYRNNCTNTNTTQACQNAFSGEYKKYSIISNAINSNTNEKKLRNYCNMGLNYDPNTTTCVASGAGIKEKYTTEEKINDIINNGIIPTPDENQQTTGENQNNVLNTLNKCENGDRDCYVNDRNFIDSLKNIYGKITGLFRERNGVNGIIPDYILRITFLTILFTVIFKK